MRIIDIYRGVNPPCHRFDTYFNPHYQKAMAELQDALEKIKPYNIPHEVLCEIESAQNRVTQVELDLMWCFAFQEGMDFQKKLGGDVKDFDISVPNLSATHQEPTLQTSQEQPE